MGAITFDTLKYSKQLEDSGIPRAQAEAQARVQHESLTLVMADVASKVDVTALQKDSDSYKLDIAAIKTDIAVMKWGIGATLAMNISMMLKMFFG